MLAENAAPVELQMITLHAGELSCRSCKQINEIPTDGFDLLWLDVHGSGDGKVLNELARRFQISPLAMEDLVNAPQRPKSELFENHLLLIAQTLVGEGQNKAVIKQVGIILGQNYVLTFHQDCPEVFRPIRERMENPLARLRHNGPDYLVYAILDTCVDRYYPVLEGLGECIESLEQDALQSPRPELLAQIHAAKNQLVRLRRSVWPMREMVLALLTDDSPFIEKSTRDYLRDTHDHCAQLADVVDMYRESTSGLVNTYMSAVAHRSNEIMKVLTLLTSVFVPPTFLAGIYGMNFSGMTELEYPGAYPLVLAMMCCMIAGTLYYFYRRGWLYRAPIVAKIPDSPMRSEAPKLVLEVELDTVRRQAA